MSKDNAEFKRLLKATGLSPKSLSVLIGASHEAVKNWSSGRTAIPDGVLIQLKIHEKNTKKVFDLYAK